MITVPHITVFDVTVREGIGQVRINFERTGGDLTPSSRITATTAESKCMAMYLFKTVC